MPEKEQCCRRFPQVSFEKVQRPQGRERRETHYLTWQRKGSSGVLSSRGVQPARSLGSCLGHSGEAFPEVLMPLSHCGALQLTKELSVSASGSQPRVTSSFRGHVTMSEDIFDWHRGGGGGECYWHAAGGSRGYCYTCYKAQNSTHNKELSSQKCAEVKKKM